MDRQMKSFLDNDLDCCEGAWIEQGQLMFIHSTECQRPESKAYWKSYFKVDHKNATQPHE